MVSRRREKTLVLRWPGLQVTGSPDQVWTVVAVSTSGPHPGDDCDTVFLVSEDTDESLSSFGQLEYLHVH